MAYEVQEFCLCGGWTNTWSDGDDNPSVYATLEEAEGELEYFFKQCHDAVVDGNMEDEPDPEDFRIVEIPIIKAWSLNIKWSNGEEENVDLPDDFRQAHKDINGYFDYLEQERNRR
jgi:hypothetical protein